MAENKVRYGLKNVHFAPVLTDTDGVLTYEEPIRFPGAVALALEPLGDTSTFRADDSAYYISVSNNGYEGTYEVAEIPLDFRTKVLGDELDPVSKVLTERADAKPKRFALMFEFDGDVKATRHVLYDCTATRPTQGSETTGESIEPGTSELTFTAAPVKGVPKRSTTAETPADIYNAWYAEVFEPVPTP